MGKKLGLILLVCLLLSAGGGLVYWKSARRVVKGSPAKWQPHTAPSAAAPAPNPAPADRTRGNGIAKESGAKNAPSAAEAGFVPRSGESLDFAANVPKLNSTIANLKIVVGEKRILAGKNVWHLQAFAHTENPYRMVFELDDQFDSYSDTGNMTSLQYEMHLSERGQKVDSVQRMLPSEQDPAPPNTIAARVLPGTRDPLGMLEYLRGFDWKKSGGISSPVYDGRKLYDVRANLVSGSAQVSVPAGNFNASKIELRVFENGVEMKDAHFMVYLTNDSARTPVLLEAVLPVLSARVELTQAR